MRNKYIIWLIILLVVANIATMSIFWLGRMNDHPNPPQGRGPKDYIIRELGFNAEQQKQYEELISVHRQKADAYQENIKHAKDAFFNLLKDPSATESTKKSAAAAISIQTEQLDLLTFEHFQKIRMLCNEEQKKKFDGIIDQVVNMMSRPKPPETDLRHLRNNLKTSQRDHCSHTGPPYRK